MKMYLGIWAAMMGVLAISCNNADQQASPMDEASAGDSLVGRVSSDTEFVLPVKDSLNVGKANWRDSLILQFINQEGNEMVRAARKENRKIEWMNNGLQQTDSAIYYTYQLGHSFEGRFVTDAWLYIDSTRRKLYELDLVEDKLIPFKVR